MPDMLVFYTVHSRMFVTTKGLSGGCGSVPGLLPVLFCSVDALGYEATQVIVLIKYFPLDNYFLH